jgi:thymidylate kinase
MVRLMEKLVPRPDLYVVLDAPATVLRERKQEVTFFEVDRQCREYRRLAERLPNAVTVDASQSLDRVVYEVLECSIERHLVRHRAFNEA